MDKVLLSDASWRHSALLQGMLHNALMRPALGMSTVFYARVESMQV